ncbi:Hydroxymethylpyrimidine/phosphomethylpyrimidine kinase (ThiD) [Fructobacillus fructosus]|uniref:hydroxymethylpyrimidine/phosphomethylpyrimidine kinase n=1 Tax=Fructobacillus fructosus TaxID=1631 RepID=UPI002D94B438|nr:Hydroxymethylpyrimidine/phosphomethylpyrimidine kinase (ThiD) [Fructobacillus fructosus]
MVKKVLTIAGSDSLSGGGLQADLATFAMQGVAGFSVISSLAIIEKDGVRIKPVDQSTFDAQLASVGQVDHFDAIKVGLLCSLEQIHSVVRFLKDYIGPVVVDPVLFFKEGNLTLERSIIKAYIEQLFPLATVATPNLREAMSLLGEDEIPKSKGAALNFTKQLSLSARCAILFKAGDEVLADQFVDLLVDEEGHPAVIRHKLIQSDYRDGAGCTLAAMLTARLAQNEELKDAAKTSIDFARQSILHGYTISSDREEGNVFPNWSLANDD